MADEPGATAPTSGSAPSPPPASAPTTAKTDRTSKSPPGASPKSPRSPNDAATEVQGAIIAADDDDDTGAAGNDNDEGIESGASSRASTSVSSSVRDYAFENSRRYHKFQEGRYHFPNDEPEQEREDMKHVMIVHLMDGKLHLAPLANPQSVLDVGTGTGIWAIDMGDEYPEADVVGIDLSPIQPNWVPPNVRFLVDDAEAEWVQHPPNSLDYVHVRHMASSVRNWPKLLGQAFDAVKPGGWVELQELRFVLSCDDGTLREGNQLDAFLTNVKDGLAVFGVNLLGMEENAARVRDAGFENVQEQVYKVPVGTWARDPTLKTIGLYNRSMIYDGLQGISMGPFTRGLKWTPEEVEVFLVGVRKALMDNSQHTYLPFHVVIGQKPVA